MDGTTALATARVMDKDHSDDVDWQEFSNWFQSTESFESAESTTGGPNHWCLKSLDRKVTRHVLCLARML